MKREWRRLWVLSFLAVFILGGLALSGSALAKEFKYKGPPAFTVTYPDNSTEEKKTSETSLLRMKAPDGVIFEISIADIPEGVALKDVGPKAYKPGLEQSVGKKAEVVKNEEYELDDGTKAYRTDMEWVWEDGTTVITTMCMSAYKAKKWVYVCAHPWADPSLAEEILESLVFE